MTGCKPVSFSRRTPHHAVSKYGAVHVECTPLRFIPSTETNCSRHNKRRLIVSISFKDFCATLKSTHSLIANYVIFICIMRLCNVGLCTLSHIYPRRGRDRCLYFQYYVRASKRQIDYALDDCGRSYVVGFGTNPLVRPHHRSRQEQSSSHNNLFPESFLTTFCTLLRL